jgi:putative SOS response-associated peptidase YedK
MCGRYTSTSTATELATAFDVEEVRTEELPLRYNVAPTQPVYAVAEGRVEQGRRLRQLGAFRWGLIPSWAKDPSVGSRMINARAETVATRTAYRDALARRRCVIPADGFYEWQVTEDDSGRRHKVPHLIRHRDGSPLAFAGLWEVWRGDPDGSPLRSCVIITTTANELLAPLHDRMPVVLPPEAWDSWLDRAHDDVPTLRGLLVPAPAVDFEAYPVGTLVNNVANDGPELARPAPPRENKAQPRSSLPPSR